MLRGECTCQGLRGVFPKAERGSRWNRRPEPFSYFYQVFQGDEYLREADLICARGFAADAYRKAADLTLPLFSFYLSLSRYCLATLHWSAGVEREPKEARDWRWRNNEEHPGGWSNGSRCMFP